MVSPLTFINIVELLVFASILLFPIALVTSITLTSILVYFGAVSFLLYLILILLSKSKKLSFPDFDYVHLAFFLYVVVFTFSSFIHTGISQAANTFFTTCKNYFVFIWVLLFALSDDKRKKIITIALLIASIISVFYGLLQAFGLDVFERQLDNSRLSGFHKNSYTYAGQLVICFFFLLKESIKSSFKNKYLVFFLYLLLGATFFCILNTSERAVIFGVILGLFVYLFFHSWQKLSKLGLVMTIILIPLALTFFINRKLLKRLQNIVYRKSLLTNPRWKLWGIALSLWKRNWLFGYGKFPHVYNEVEGIALGKVFTHAHNVYLQVLVTNGVVGLLAFLNLFFAFLKTSISNLKFNQYAMCFIAIISAFFIEGFFEFFWGDTEVKYLILYFAGFVCSFNQKKM